MKPVEPGHYRVLVTDASRGAAVAAIRSLSRRGHSVIAADSEPRSPGFASRYIDGHFLYTCPTKNPIQFIDDILDCIQRYQIDMIVPVTDRAILPLESARDKIDPVCKVVWAPKEAMAIVRNKDLTFQLAEELGIPYPKTRLVSHVDEALEFARQLGWPVVLKPVSSHTLTQEDAVKLWSVTYARNETELVTKMKAFQKASGVLLQEYFSGAGIGVEVLANQGRIHSAFQHRRLREVPITGGTSSLRCSEALHPNLLEQTIQLVHALNWTGLAMVEFKLNAAGESRLMEINGRIWGSLPLAVESGVDFPARLCDLAMNGPSRPPDKLESDYRVGLHVQNLEKELSWIFQVLRGRPSKYELANFPSRFQALGAIADLMKPHYRFDILSWRDPKPGVRMLTNLLLKATSSILRKKSARQT